MRLNLRLFVVVPLVVLCSCAAGSLLAYKLSPDYPDDAANDTQPLTGLKAPAKITYDDWGVAHVEAASFEDLSRAAGYAQGRDRFFQLDLLRRLARGRVSELVGDQPLLAETTVDYDRTMRGWLIEQRCAQAVKKMTPDQRAILEAFASGVNQALAKWKPLEYRLLRVEPEAWTVEDSLAIGLLNVWSLSHNWSQEASRLVLAGSVGVERAELIYPSEPVGGGRTIVSSGVPSLPPSVVPELAGMFPWKKTTTASRDTLHVGVDALAMMGASNEWVVDGKHTKSGKPMLANDPHLSHLLPGMFYPMHVRVESIGLDAIGVTMPGMPLVVLGHNQKVAWGMTSSVADAIDLVLEKQVEGGVVDERGPCPITERIEMLKVRDGSELKEKPVRLRQTCHGPVLNDIYPELLPDTAPLVSIRWNTDGLESTVDGLLALDLAGSTAEAGRAATSLPKLYQVFAAADVEGHIGLWSTGQVPKRPNHRGTFPVPGWVAKYDYNEWASGEQLPFSVDPAGGVLANGNNLVREPGAPGFERLNVDAAQGFRHDRIVELIAQNPAHDSESMQKIQTDTASPRAALFRAAMIEDLGGAQLTGTAAAALEVLKAWDGSATTGSAGPSIFFATYREAILGAMEDELPPSALRFFMAQRYSMNACDGWMTQPQAAVWDDLRTPAREGRAEIVRAAFLRATAEFAKTLGDDPKRWTWGKVHVMRPTHPFGSKAALDSLVNLEPTPAAGELDSVWKSHFDFGNARAPYKPVAGPVYRMVADLADLTHARWIIDTGASGWPGSPHYGDQYQQWRKGELIPMRFDLAEVRANPHGELTLQP